MQTTIDKQIKRDTRREAPPLGRFYEVNGRRLLLHRSGAGGPAVVFAPGAGTIGLDYLNIHEQVSQFTTSVIYDRAGTGWSEDVKLPRNATQVTDELRSLLQAADVPAPYLLVGHSLGGIYTRRYAQRFPNEVAGLLFLDPAHEGYLVHEPKLKLRDQLKQGLAILNVLLHFEQTYRRLFSRMLSQWPESIREQLIEYHLKTWKKSIDEGKNLKSALYDEVRQGEDMPDVPLMVLIAMGIDPFMAALLPEGFLRELNDSKHAFYTEFARSVPQGEYRVLENAGHSTIHTDCPDAVVQAIRDLISGYDVPRILPAFHTAR